MAHLPVQSDCESDAACILNAHVEQRFLQYWTRFPTGAHLVEALTQGEEYVRGVTDGDCQTKEAIKILADIRTSLMKVMDSAKQKILMSLTETEGKCAR